MYAVMQRYETNALVHINDENPLVLSDFDALIPLDAIVDGRPVQDYPLGSHRITRFTINGVAYDMSADPADVDEEDELDTVLDDDLTPSIERALREP